MSNRDASDNDAWVRLVSSDGYSFLVKRGVAMMSGTLKNMLSFDSNFKEALANVCPISERAPIVEKVCEYMSFRAHYEGAGSKEDIPINEFTERFPLEIVLELLLAADYLEGKSRLIVFANGDPLMKLFRHGAIQSELLRRVASDGSAACTVCGRK